MKKTNGKSNGKRPPTKREIDDMAASIREGAAMLRGEVGGWELINDEPSPAEMSKQIRKKLGIPQWRLAQLMCVRFSAIGRWETGRGGPRGSEAVLLRLAFFNPEILNTPPPNYRSEWRPPERMIEGELPEWVRKRPPPGFTPREVARDILESD